MKILFLHLSDAHITCETDMTEINPGAIVIALTQVEEFDECVFVFSGDIAAAGKKEEYEQAYRLISYILKGINDRFFDGNKSFKTLIVPGNHDNLVLDKERDHAVISDYYRDKKKNIDSYYYDDLQQLNAFFEFAQRRHCYKEARCVDVQYMKFGSFCIRANLINTAPLSILGSDNGDKGLHHIPEKELKKLELDANENYTITIMHHGPEWFSDLAKKSLYEKINNKTNLLFVGHEHYTLNESKVVNGKHIDISSGVALSNTHTEHGFNAVLLDTVEGKLTERKFIYNGRFYKPSGDEIVNSEVVFKGKFKFVHTKEFRNYLERDGEMSTGETYLGYFVFPTLEAKEINNTTKNYSIASADQFVELMERKQRITIEGSLRSGKTTLAKYLCRFLSEKYVPILLSESDFAPKKAEYVLSNAIREQYGKSADYDEFIQLAEKNKILIVDRSDRIPKEKWDAFKEKYNGTFGKIILITGVDWNFNIKEKVIEDIEENLFFSLKISPFYYVKRKELIEKICDNSQVDVNEIVNTVRKINDDIIGQIKLFQLTPDFIHQYVNYYLNFSFMKTQNDSNVFSKVFEANITFQLTKNTNEENVAEIFIALDFVANYMHFNKKSQISSIEFEEQIEKYNEKYDNNLKPRMVYEVTKKSNIIRDVSDRFDVEFCDESYLAYFTALHLNRELNEGNGIDELSYLLDNICFGINGDIILFLSYITSNVKVLGPIFLKAEELMKAWDELCFDKNNISYLTKHSSRIAGVNAPTEEDKKKNIEGKNETEKEIIEKKKQKSNELYSYNENDANSFENKIAKALCYLDLIAKILPNFRHILGAVEKKNLVEVIYRYPNKLLYFMLSKVDEHLAELIEEVLREHPKTKQGIDVTYDMLEKSLQTRSMAIILSVYSFVGETAASGKGMVELNKFDYSSDSNHALQNIMMEEQTDSFHVFYTKVSNFYSKTNEDMLKHMIKCVVRHYYFNHDVKFVGEGQQLFDKFFNKKERKKVQLLQAKNKFEKR